MLSRLQEIESHTYSCDQAKEAFQGSEAQLDNPLLIDEEIQYQHQIFSRLRFAYSEQETRDKFLRQMSEMSTISDFDADILGIEKEAVAKKHALKARKQRLHEQIESSEAVIREMLVLHQDSRTKIKKAGDLLDRVAHLEAQIDSEMDSGAAMSQEEYREVFSVPVECESVEKLISEKRNEVERATTELERVARETSAMSESLRQYVAKNETDLARLDELRQSVGEIKMDDVQEACRRYKDIEEVIRILEQPDEDK